MRVSPHVADRLGVLAAGICAIHCMAAPVVLAFAPLVGGLWTSPATHWAFAAVSLPAAISLLRRNMRHQRPGVRRILSALATVGCTLIVLGLMVPGSAWAQTVGVDLPCPDWLATQQGAQQGPQLGNGCVDECCASVQDSRVFVPLASLLTMAGGVLLVTAHVTALRGRGCCDPADDAR